MSIYRRVWFIGFALVSLVVLAACGGNGGDGGDGDGSGVAFQLPVPGEYSLAATGTIEIDIVREEVNAAPLALGAPETGEFSGGLTIQLGEDGKFTISNEDGVLLVVEEVKDGPITLRQNEDKPSTGTISEDGVEIELNVLAELGDGVTTTHEQPFLLEGDGDPLADEGATVAPPADAEPVRFMPVEGYRDLNMAIIEMFIIPSFREQEEFQESLKVDFSDPVDDATDCGTGAAVDDPAVEISGVNVTRVGEDLEVEVATVQSPTKSFEESYSMAIILLLFGYEGLAEFHAGLQQQGQTDSKGNVIPGTEGSVTRLSCAWTAKLSSFALSMGRTPKLTRTTTPSGC